MDTIPATLIYTVCPLAIQFNVLLAFFYCSNSTDCSDFPVLTT